MVVLGIFDRLKENVVKKIIVYLIFIKVYLRGINCQLDFKYLHINVRIFSLFPCNPYLSECYDICVVHTDARRNR